MFVRTKPINNTSRKRVQICECIRIGDKVKQKVIKHVGIAEASKMLFQQAIQAAQAIYQDMGQDIQSSSQDISAFLQAFTQISSSMTQQA